MKWMQCLLKPLEFQVFCLVVVSKVYAPLVMLLNWPALEALAQRNGR